MVNHEQAVDWAVLLRMVGNCYEFARGEETHIETDLGVLNLRGVFTVRLMVASLDAGLEEEIGRRENMEDPKIF
ncbi:MAG: hypothetical protein RIA08_17140 [Roseovarius sp.]|uniref:hypothetical protein n=1 Tax=Roseovarius sp. TaxID=1486281 RepID=UPI0032EB8FD1